MKVCSVTNCTKESYIRTYCVTHYNRWWKTGIAYDFYKPTPAERFEMFVDRSNTNGCHLWIGFREHFYKSGNYGKFKLNNKSVKAHRFAYELSYGPIPVSKLVLHTCDNPPCVNPNHLYLGTQKQNMLDRKNRGRTYFEIGEKSHEAKLTEKQVLEIRDRFTKEKISFSELGRQYNVTHACIRYIIIRHTWKHLP